MRWPNPGCALVTDEDRHRLTSREIVVREVRIAASSGDGQLERIVFASGEALSREGILLRPPQRQASELRAKLGCACTTPLPGVEVVAVQTQERGRSVTAAPTAASARSRFSSR